MANKLPKARLTNYEEHTFFDFSPVSPDKNDKNDVASDSPKIIVYSRGILVLYQSKQYEQCLQLIEEFNNLPPTHPQYRNEDSRNEFIIIQAACYSILGINVGTAFELLNQVLARDPNNSFALYGLGLAKYNSGDFRGCISPFQKAIELNPTAMIRAVDYKQKAERIENLAIQANEEFKLNNFCKMNELIQSGSAIDPGITTTLKKIREYFLSKVIGRLETEVKNQSKYSNAESLIMNYKREEAKLLVDEIYEEQPRTSHAIFLKGLFQYMNGELNDAAKEFSSAKQSFEKANDYYKKTIAIQKILAEVTEDLEKAQFPSAVDKLTLALKVDPKNLVVSQLMHFQRALGLFHLEGRVEECRVELKKYEQHVSVVGNIVGAVLEIMKKQTEGK